MTERENSLYTLTASVIHAVAVIGFGLMLFAITEGFRPRTSDSAAISIERCFKLGGVPVLDGWTGNPTACIFPPHPKEMR